MILCNLAGMKKAEVDELRRKSHRTAPGWIDRLLKKHEASFTTVSPERTDDPDDETPDLPLVYRHKVRDLFTRTQIKEMLIAEFGCQCWGCTFKMPKDDERSALYFDVDHKDPRSGGGSNRLPNRALLCGPCNRKKSDRITLVALREAVMGKKAAKNHPVDLGRAGAWADRREMDALRAVSS